MTKLKSKKMTKSTLAIIIMGIAIVALIAFGGSFAYFSASSSDTNSSITTGYVKLSDNGAIYGASLTNKLPGDTLFAAEAITLAVDTTDSTGNYVAIKFEISAVTAGISPAAIDIADLGLNVDAALATTWKQVYKHGAGTEVSPYTYDLTSTGDDNPTATGIYVYVGAGSTATYAANEATLIVNANALTLDAEDVWAEGEDASEDGLMGATITVTLTGRSLQYAHVPSADVVAELVDLFD